MAPLGDKLSSIATPPRQSGNNEMALVLIGQQAFIIFNNNPVLSCMHETNPILHSRSHTIFIRKEIWVVDKFEPCKLTLSQHSSWKFHCTGSALRSPEPSLASRVETAWVASCVTEMSKKSTVQCHCNTVSFLQNIHNIHPIARPWGWDMGCLLWVKSFMHVLPQSLQWWMHYCVLLHCLITALHCMPRKWLKTYGNLSLFCYYLF